MRPFGAKHKSLTVLKALGGRATRIAVFPYSRKALLYASLYDGRGLLR